MEPLPDSGGGDKVALGSAFNDTIVVKDVGGSLVVDLSSGEDPTFTNPGAVTSLTIDAGNLDDTITIQSLPAAFKGTLKIHGQDGNDTIVFAASLSLPGSTIEADAETLTVSTGVQLDTRPASGDSGPITLTGKTIKLESGSKLLAGAVGAGAAGNVTIKAEDIFSIAASKIASLLPASAGAAPRRSTSPERRSTGADISITTEASAFTSWQDQADYWDQIKDQLFGVLQQAPNIALSSVSPFTGQVKIQFATAQATLTDTTVTGTGKVEITAKASADASFTAIGINADVSGASTRFRPSSSSASATRKRPRPSSSRARRR